MLCGSVPDWSHSRSSVRWAGDVALDWANGTPKLLLAKDERLMGSYRNGPWLNAISWFTTAVLIVLTAMMIWFTLRP